VQEAQCLANQIEMYYCNPEEDKIKLLDTFTQKPAEFKHQDLIAQLDTVNLLAK
jgi:ATP synthase F1 complex assembly factor 1